ncbi:MAG: SDR family oxidoreductase [Vicinamibacteria bacterium]|jgi:NAD(P)-dependent dehydrogenase (short-subunit alcohol dehydrogenase family)|nr:SDR family oxidoreductase [Vicinamibacteria bacterium]MBP9946367.1 SDR family oxidoreductase [Vicinamibacteria bacterium]
MKFDGKVALVTGGGRGIGAEIARNLARDGAAVAISARTESEVLKVVEEIVAKGGRAQPFIADLSQADQAAGLVGRVQAAMGPIDFLINNAGIAGSAPVIKQTLDEWNRIFAINVTATFLCTQAALPKMIERGSGRVVNIASVAARFGARYIGAYAASKHAVLGFTRCVAAEVAAFGITANAVCPGFVDTEMVSSSVTRIVEKTGLPAEQALDTIKSQSPQKRLLTTSEVAAMVSLLCSEEGRGINGQALVIDGGGLLA